MSRSELLRAGPVILKRGQEDPGRDQEDPAFFKAGLPHEAGHSGPLIRSAPEVKRPPQRGDPKHVRSRSDPPRNPLGSLASDRLISSGFVTVQETSDRPRSVKDQPPLCPSYFASGVSKAVFRISRFPPEPPPRTGYGPAPRSVFAAPDISPSAPGAPSHQVGTGSHE